MKFKRFVALICIGALMMMALGGCAVLNDEGATEPSENGFVQSAQ